jgi:fructose-specific phosphotransferase system IIC component
MGRGVSRAAPLLLALLLAGCAGTAELVRALAADPAAACITAQAAGSSVAIARTGQAGLEISAGHGSCTVRPAPRP